jgi:hypothetical protein
MPHSPRLHVAVWCTSLWSGWLSWRILLLAGRRGESYARTGAASRAAPWELAVWSPSVRWLEGAADGRLEDAQQRTWRRPVVLGSHITGDGAAVPGMVVQRRGWPHRTGVGGGDALH